MAELSQDAELNSFEREKPFLPCRLQAGSFGEHCKEVRGQTLTRMGVQGEKCFAQPFIQPNKAGRVTKKTRNIAGTLACTNMPENQLQ